MRTKFPLDCRRCRPLKQAKANFALRRRVSIVWRSVLIKYELRTRSSESKQKIRPQIFVHVVETEKNALKDVKFSEIRTKHNPSYRILSHDTPKVLSSLLIFNDRFPNYFYLPRNSDRILRNQKLQSLASWKL